MAAKRDHSIRIPVTAGELRSAQRLAEKLDTPIALLVRKALRELEDAEEKKKR